jgi:hypothetical protein
MSYAPKPDQQEFAPHPPALGIARMKFTVFEVY